MEFWNQNLKIFINRENTYFITKKKLLGIGLFNHNSWKSNDSSAVNLGTLMT